MHCFSPFFYREAKFGPIEKRTKTNDLVEIKFFRRPARYTKEMKKFLEELKVEPVDEKLRRYKSYWL